jgi:hypothetical protein
MGLTKMFQQRLEQQKLEMFEDWKKPKRKTVASHRKDSYYAQIIEAERNLKKKKQKR